MRFTISNQENNMMSVAIDGLAYDNLDASQLDQTIHAVQWYDNHGEIEYKDPATGKMTGNVDIDSIDAFQFAIDAFNTAKTTEEAEKAEQALQEARTVAFQTAYQDALDNGLSEEDAITAGQTAQDQVT